MLPNPMQTPPIGGMAPMNTTPPMNMMPPMPPMGKMPPMEMNLDPMARQNFNNLMSGIQSQSMIPPMPMRMNEGGSVNPLMALIQGLGRLFGFGGDQEPSRGMSFGDAFAKARREGKKVFEYNGKMYTTELKEEQAARIEKEQNEKNKVEQVVEDVVNQYGGGVEQQLETETDPTSAMTKRDSVADLLIQAQQSQSDTPTMGDEFDVQRRGPEDFAPMPQFTGFDPKVPPGGRPVPLRQGDEFLLAAGADAPNVEGKTISFDDLQKINDLTASINANVGGANRVEPIEAQLNALINMSPGSVRETTTKPDVLTEGIAPLSFKEQLRSLLQGLDNMGLSNQLSSSINDKLNQLDGLTSSRSRRDVRKALGMKEGGSVTDAIARLENGGDAESESFQQRLEKFFGRGILDNLSEEDKEFLKIGGGVTALNLTAMPVIKSLIDEKGRLNKRFFNPEYDFRGRELEDKAFKKYMKEMGLNKDFYKKPAMSFGEFYKNLPDSEKTLDKKKILMNMLKRGLGTAAKGGSILAGFTPKMMADASLPESMIVNKNQGGVVPIQGFTNGGSPTENVKPFFDKDNIFESTLDKLNQTFGPADTGTGGQYASAKDQAAAENKGKSFFGATSYSYPIGDNILRLSTPTSTGNPFGDESNEEIARNRAVKAYRDAVVGGGYDLFGTPGDRGIRYYDFDDYRKMQDLTPYSEMESPPNVNVDIYKQRPYIVKQGGVDLVGVTDPETGKFRPLTFNDAEQAKLSGIVGPVETTDEEVITDDGSDQNVVDDSNTGTTMTSTATTPISPFAQIEQETVVPSTRTVDASFNPSFTPLASTDIYNPNFLTDMPDFSALSIDPSQSAAVDLQKFLDIDEDKTAPKAFTPDTTNITDIMKASGYQQGGAVSPGLNMAIDKFISAYS